MQISLKRQKSIQIDTFVNERLITDSTWKVFADNNSEDTIYIVMKDKEGKNQVRINIKKLTDFEDVDVNK